MRKLIRTKQESAVIGGNTIGGNLQCTENSPPPIVSPAAGPKGRSGEVATDAYMRAEILTYSRSRGLFAGVSLKGSTLRQDNGANEDLYGQKISAREIVLEGKVSMPSAGRSLVELLQKKISTAQRGEKPAIQYYLRDKPTDWSRLSFWISIPLSCLFFLISLWVTVRLYKKQ